MLSYAIFYAERGFPLVPRIVSTIIPAVDYFQSEWPSSGEVWLVNGKAPHPDKPFRTPAIAATYTRILAEAEAAGGDRVGQIEAARHAFYKGFVAEAIDRFYRTELMDFERHAPCRAAQRRRSRALCGARRADGLGRLSRVHGAQARALVAGPDAAADAAAARSVSTSAPWTRSDRTSSTPWWRR